MKYSCIATERRPKIPRLQHSKHLLDSVKTMNLVLSKHLEWMPSQNQGMQGASCGRLYYCIITKQARKKLRNISVAWIDYKKAFDSVPHTWLIKVLEIHGIASQIIDLLKQLMNTWRTALLMHTREGRIESDKIRIRRGLFQGDTLSPIWFCLALNPLSKLLNNTPYGYVIDKHRDIRISHRLYIDDLKIYASNSEQQRRQLEIIAAFSDAIRMEMGVDKCATLEVK